MGLSLYIKEFFNAVKLRYNHLTLAEDHLSSSQVSKIRGDTYDILNSDKELNQNINYKKVAKMMLI